MRFRTLVILAALAAIVAVAAALTLRSEAKSAQRSARDRASKSPVTAAAAGVIMLPNVDVLTAAQNGDKIDATIAISNSDPSARIPIDRADILYFDGLVGGVSQPIGAHSVGGGAGVSELNPGAYVSLRVSLTSRDPVAQLRVVYSRQQGGFLSKGGPSAPAQVKH